MVKKLLLYTVCMLLSLPAILAQQYPVRNYRMSNGLANSVVFRSYQDRRGFMWFCTNYGISRFDGTTFQNYSSREGLGANTIMSMSIDSGHRSFISTYGGGLDVLDNGWISPYKLRSGTMPKKVVYATRHGNRVWLISTNMVTLYHITDGVIKEVPVSREDGSLVRFSKTSVCGNELLLTSTDGLYIANTDGTVRPYLRDLVHEPINDIRQDSNGFLWAGVSGSVLKIAGDKIVQRYPMDSKLPPGDILIDHLDNVWVAGAEGGIYLVQNNKLSDLTPMLNTGDAIIHDLFEDREGNIWIATGGQGVYQLRSLNIVNYPVEAQKIKSYCKCISRVNDTEALVASIGTLSKWAGGELRPVPVKALTPVAYIYFIQYLDGNIYIGTPYGLIIRHPDGKEDLVQASAKVPTGAVSMLAEKDSLWIGAFNAIYKVKKGANTLDSQNMVLTLNRCNTIYKTTDGSILFGTDSGVVSYRNKTFQYRQLSDKTAANSINVIYEDSRGRTWYATDSGLAYTADNGIKWITIANGLTHNKCNSIQEDKYGTLWVGTANGITSIDLGTMRMGNMQTGNFENEVLSVCCMDSLLFAGMVDGMTVVRREQGAVHPAPPLYITAVRTASGIQNMPTVLNIPYEQNKLVIEFAALSFAYPEEVRYRYRIRDLSDNWHVTANKQVDIQALPAGDLTFEVSAMQANGAWSAPVSLPIHVSTPFWQNKWLIALFFVTLSWLTYFITRKLIEQREEKKRRRLSLYNRIIYLKQQALSALINPHFIFNCMNSIQHYMHGHDHYMANLYLSDFAHLIRMTLEQSRSAFIPLDHEIARLRLYLSLEQLRFGDELQYELYTDPNVELASPRIPNMLVQPYVENAIWHGIMPNNGIGKIAIRFMEENERELRIEIRDNGIGINKSKASRKHADKPSLGMKLTSDRLHVLQQMLGQRFSVTIEETSDAQGVVTGTLVKIILPYIPNEERLEMGNDTPERPA